MNKKQKLRVILGCLFAILFIIWIFIPSSVLSKVFGLASNGLGCLAMAVSYWEEDKNQEKTE